ncbi:myosin-14-like [Cynara cardunculus var. scolymus]|uniref:myosin-14-like n=1 Tax=Cynara cardunculus var. scolymus TaxID=59895 RepID=UPI000D62B13F|nr:myosin-14-like [Cynara cardunculus var. scolymus]
MIAFYEREYRGLKEKYDKLTLELDKNSSWTICLTDYNERKEEEKKVLQEKLNEFMNNASAGKCNIEQTVEGLTVKLHEAEKRDLTDEKLCELEKRVNDKLEKTLDAERKELEDEIRSSNKIKQDLVIKLRKAESELHAERNSQGNNHKEVEELTKKLRKSESELIDGKKLLEQEKEKVLEAENMAAQFSITHCRFLRPTHLTNGSVTDELGVSSCKNVMTRGNRASWKRELGYRLASGPSKRGPGH